jgi:hypothetical protein
MKKPNFNSFKLILLLLFLLTNSNLINSQTFINPGAEWNFWNTVDGGGHEFYESWQYREDVTIDSIIYHKIEGIYRYYYPWSGNYSEIGTTISFLLRNSGDSVMISDIDGTNEKLLYDFTPLIGNTWDVTELVEWTTIAPTSPLIVETIDFGDTIINGQIVNWVEVINNNPDSLGFNGKIFNHFGMQPFIPFWADGTLHIRGKYWKCYSDNVLGNIGYSPCIDIDILELNKLPDNDLFISTNYYANQIQINCKNKNELEIMYISDSMGRIIEIMKGLNNGYIELSVPSGIYFLTFRLNDLTYCEKFLWIDEN